MSQPESQDVRSFRIGGLVARVVGKAVHDAVTQDEATKTRHGQEAIADALLAFAKVLAANHFRGVDQLIEAANLARHAHELLRKGAVSIIWFLAHIQFLGTSVF